MESVAVSLAASIFSMGELGVGRLGVCKMVLKYLESTYAMNVCKKKPRGKCFLIQIVKENKNIWEIIFFAILRKEKVALLGQKDEQKPLL